MPFNIYCCHFCFKFLCFSSRNGLPVKPVYYGKEMDRWKYFSQPITGLHFTRKPYNKRVSTIQTLGDAENEFIRLPKRSYRQSSQFIALSLYLIFKIVLVWNHCFENIQFSFFPSIKIIRIWFFERWFIVQCFSNIFLLVLRFKELSHSYVWRLIETAETFVYSC